MLRRFYGEIIGEAGETVIGNNVFIGMNSIILMGTKIGNNVIVGAGSVVSGEIPDNCVIAGNPAKIIRSLEDHYKKRKERSLCEAEIYYRKFKEKYGRRPSVKEMGPFFPLFLERSKDAINRENVNVNLNGDDMQDIIECFLKSEPMFENYERFINYLERDD